VIAGDLFKWFPTATVTEPADLIFLDPPYRFLNEQPEKLRALSASIAEKHLAEDGLLVFRHDVADTLDLPPLKLTDRRDYGSMAIEFLSHAQTR
jgi:16S rRNA G966 N2-methylase RsmD